MPKIYRLEDKHALTDMMSYRYSEAERLFHILRSIPDQYQTETVKTEDDVIREWSEFAKIALQGEYSESKQKCWVGHYEQFGRVMLHLAQMSVTKMDARKTKNEFLECVLPDEDTCQFIFSGPSGTEDRIYYRCWFALIGHPDFLTQNAIGMECVKYSYTELVLNIALQDVGLARRLER